MDHTPTNPKLWALYVAQAKARFPHYPSPAAAHWVHDKYVKAGGRFIATDHADQDTVKGRKDEVHKKAVEKKKVDEESDPTKKNKK